MPYPSKINRIAVTDAALALVAREGGEALTLRRLASDLGVTANALYRYYNRRDVLVAATADAVAHRLHAAIERGMAAVPSDAGAAVRVRALLDIYASFANANPALYGLFLNASHEAGAGLPQPRYHEKLWDQSLAIIMPLVGEENAPSATVTMWGMVHGIWSLRLSDVLGGRKPSEIDDYAFDAIIKGLADN